jgi:hypothetical protein
VEVNVPGVMAILVAPVTTQLKVLFVPEFTLVGFALKDVIAGVELVPGDEFDEAPEPQPVRPAQANEIRIIAQSAGPKERSFREIRSILQDLAKSKHPPLVAVNNTILKILE